MIKPWYRVAFQDSDTVFHHAREAIVLSWARGHDVFRQLWPLLDGRRSTAEILSELGDSAEAGVRIMGILAAHDLLGEGAQLRGTPSNGAVIENLEPLVSDGGVVQRLAEARVFLRTDESELRRLVHDALTATGVTVVSGDERRTVDDAVTDIVVVSSAPDVVAEWNRHALETGRRWLHVGSLTGGSVTVGPLFVPGETCCYECFQIRRAANTEYRTHYASVDRASADRRLTPAMKMMVAGFVSELVTRELVGAPHGATGSVYVFETGWRLELHRATVYRVPRCPACSPLRSRGSQSPWFHELLG